MIPRRLAHRLEYLGILLARGLDRLLGPRLSAVVGGALGRFVYRAIRIRRDLVEAHLRRAFPDRDERWIRATAADSYAHLAREGLAMLRLSRLGADDVIGVTRVEGVDRLREAVEAGTGAVVATGHLGNWEIGGAAVAARGIPLDVVVQRQANPLFDRLVNRARERLGMRVIERGRATKETLRALRAGRVVALVADQDARRSGIFVPFLGRAASTFRGPAVLALRSGAPLFIGTAVRRGASGYDVRIERIEVPPEDDFDAAVRRLTAAHVAALEAAVRRDPAQYLWHHRRWKTAPPGPGLEAGSGNGAAGSEVLEPGPVED